MLSRPSYRHIASCRRGTTHAVARSPQHDAEQAYHQHRDDQERLNISDLQPSPAGKFKQEAGTKIKNTFHSSGTRGIVEMMTVGPDRENPDPCHPWPWREQQYERHHEFAGGATNMSDEVGRFRRT